MNKMNRFYQLYDKVINDLERNLPAYLTYHNCDHTKLVLKKVVFIGEMEKVSDEELFLLKVAALYHDTGYMKSNENHEAESCRIAEKELTESGFEKTEIDQLCGMIMATRIPQEPKAHLEGILADADLEYLGTPEFEIISNKLYTEMKHFRPGLTLKQWYELQIKFFTLHHYHTNYCRIYREPYKLINLEDLQEKLQLLL